MTPLSVRFSFSEILQQIRQPDQEYTQQDHRDEIEFRMKHPGQNDRNGAPENRPNHKNVKWSHNRNLLG